MNCGFAEPKKSECYAVAINVQEARAKCSGGVARASKDGAAVARGGVSPSSDGGNARIVRLNE